MTVVRRPLPFRELRSLHQAIDRLFGNRLVRPGRWTPAEDGGQRALDVQTTGDELDGSANTSPVGA